MIMLKNLSFASNNRIEWSVGIGLVVVHPLWYLQPTPSIYFHKTKHFPSFGHYECIHTALSHIKKNHPRSKICKIKKKSVLNFLVGVGMSMGGLLVMKYLSQLKRESLIDSAVILSAGVDATKGKKGKFPEEEILWTLRN